jgi:hypothetical protein
MARGQPERIEERHEIGPGGLDGRPDRCAGRDRGVERAQLVPERLLVRDPELDRLETGRGAVGAAFDEPRREVAEIR